MNLKYEWEPEEWREALLLASAGPRQPSKPLMVYGVVGVMALGALGELVNTVRSSSESDYGGSLMPMLLFAAAVVVATQVYAKAASRTRRLRPLAPMPAGEQKLTVSEGGWRVATADDDDAERPWAELREQRTGVSSMILVGQGNTFAALPLRALTPSQGGQLQRLLRRKLHAVR